MSNDRIVVQLTITVDCDGKTVCKIEPPIAGTGVCGSDAPASGSAPAGGSTPATSAAPPAGTSSPPTGTGIPPAAGTGGATPGAGVATPAAPTAKCAAQRTVHIVAGNGGLAWFTLIWPLPYIVVTDNAAFAIDDRTHFGIAPGTGSDHPLHVRKIGARLVWDGTGAHPQPTVFVAGVNQTHTRNPQTMTIAGGPDVVAAGAAAQAALAAPLPVLSFSDGLPFGLAAGAPGVAVVANIDGAIAALRLVTSISPAVEQDLRPSATTIATWVNAQMPTAVTDFARNLLFTANAFRLGLISTVLMPAFNDDPHGAFAGGDWQPAACADVVARILDGFYAELAAHSEPKCSPVGTPLSLADNVVTIMSGDTPKTPFNRNGWGDGTPGNSNLVYVRSNGYLKPGWFGDLTMNGRVNFDPATGAQFAAANALSTTAAQLGILFAITRGNVAAVTAASSAPYAGVVATTLP